MATIMKVGNLRDCNVTQHLNITNKREAISDIAAMYIIIYMIINIFIDT